MKMTTPEIESKKKFKRNIHTQELPQNCSSTWRRLKIRSRIDKIYEQSNQISYMNFQNSASNFTDKNKIYSHIFFSHFAYYNIDSKMGIDSNTKQRKEE